MYFVQADNRVSFVNNGESLSFSSLLITDEEYYGCGVIDSVTNKLKLINSFYLYVRGLI